MLTRKTHIPLACFAIFCAFVRTSPGWTGERVELKIGTVLATNTGREFDQRLGRMRRPLKNLFRYSSYRLVQEEERRVSWGSQVGFHIPGGRYLQVVPKGYKDNQVSMRVMLLEGSRPLVDTVFTLRNHGTLLVGGPRHQEGVLIISIGAGTEE